MHPSAPRRRTLRRARQCRPWSRPSRAQDRGSRRECSCYQPKARRQAAARFATERVRFSCEDSSCSKGTYAIISRAGRRRTRWRACRKATGDATIRRGSQRRRRMRVVTLEEHFTAPDLVRRIDPEAIKRRGYRPRKLAPGGPNPMELAPEIGERRLQSMDEAGITVQVLSNTGPGPDLVPGADGVALAREMNDHLAEATSRRPDRFAGFAVLPMQSDTSTADELVRAVRQLRFVGA